MALTLINIYNDVAGQAWSMFDGDAENSEELESALKSSINKALTELWCSYSFPFRIKNTVITTRADNQIYPGVDGNIFKKSVSGNQVYSIRIGTSYLSYLDDYELLEEQTGKPYGFYIKNDNIYLHPVPDDVYSVNIEYLALAIGENDFGEPIYSLQDDKDSINIPQKYETIFKHALITRAMMYAIASETDENYSGYKEQYEKAYKILLNYSSGINRDKRVFW